MTDRTVFTEDAGEYRIRIEYDDDPNTTPRDWCNLTTIRGWHRRMVVGDGPNIDTNAYESWDDMLASIIAEHDAVMVAPLFWYEHSGVSCRMGTPITVGSTDDAGLAAFRSACLDDAGWDSGVAGLVIVSRASQAECGTSDDDLAKAAEGEVAEYDAWLRGEVYGYVIEKLSTCDHGDEHADVVGSCWGFVGDMDYCLSEARAELAGIRGES